MTKRDLTDPVQLGKFLDDGNKPVKEKDSMIKVSSLPKVGGARVKVKTRLQEMALEKLDESKANKKELHDFAWDEYQRVGHDLPSYGEGHHDAAHDHVTDRMYEKFHKSHPKVNFRKETKHALRGIHDDRKETRQNEAKQARREAARNRPPKVKKTKESEPWWKKAGYSVPLSKPRRGIGSY